MTATNRTAVPGLAEAYGEAFVYGLATVDLYRILRDFTLDASSREFKAPLNVFGHARAVANPDDHAIVAMNVDTPYSYAWLDLRAEPVVVTIPPFEEERYVSAELFDLYTYIVGYVSPRTNGNRGGTFLVAGPDWAGNRPDGVDGVFRCDTDLALVLLRTQLFGESDTANVRAIQDRCAVAPLSAVTSSTPPAPAPPLAPIPPVDVRGTLDKRFFDVLDWMLALMPVLEEDRPLRRRLADAGIGPGAPLAHCDDTAVAEGMAAGLADVLARAKTVRSSGEIFGSRAHFAGDHLSRAAGAFLGILGNSEEEYLGVGYQADADGQPFDGARRYAITFPPAGLPPVDAFWSITAYTAERLLYANPLHRYAISSRALPEFARDPDGSITIDVRHDPPDPGREPNWLPVPDAPFNLAFRTYLPGAAIRSGKWQAPPVRPSA